MPESARAKLTPEQIAKFQAADAGVLAPQTASLDDEWKSDGYIPQEAPSELLPDIEKHKEKRQQHKNKR